MAATLILSNKIIDKERLKSLWEEIKMLDIIEIAREKGMEEGKEIGLREGKAMGVQEGKALGVQEGKAMGVQEGKAMGVQEGKAPGVQEGSIQTSREMLTDMLIEKFGAFSLPVTERISAIANPRILKILFRQALKCQNVQEFETAMQQMG